MASRISILLIISGFSMIDAFVGTDFNCTIFNGRSFVYDRSAFSCLNVFSDSTCDVLYPISDRPLAVGNDAPRPLFCYTTSTATPAAIVQDMKRAAIRSCPRTCGYCCNTDAFNCRNAAFPRITCSTITQSQCNSPQLRSIIASDCPSSCGFCNDNGCVDAITGCEDDLSICRNIALQDFVNEFCRRTCYRCTAGTSTSTRRLAGTTTPSTCTRFAPDVLTQCATLAENGFCTNEFFTLEQRRSRCATTCRLC